MNFVATFIRDIKTFAGIGNTPTEEAKRQLEYDLRRDQIHRSHIYAQLRALDVDIDNFRVGRSNPTA